MPSEGNGTSLLSRALAAMEPRLQAFRTAVAAARTVVSRYQVLGRGGAALETEWALMELGPFAVGRIDVDRFARLTAGSEAPGLDVVSAIERAGSVLSAFADGAALQSVRVDPGGDLHDVVKEALTRVGRVFGAARVIELARIGAYEEARHARLLEGMRYRTWNRAERALAPPVVVEVRGEDCFPAGLGEFLEGGACIVLVVSGPTSPAPLARLITPGTFVAQTTDPGDLVRMAASGRPGIALLLDAERDEQAIFVHDPDAGGAPWSRLEVRRLPPDPEGDGGPRARPWIDEVRHLRSLAERPVGSAEPVVPAEDATAAPADKLAAWLLAQADLGGA